MIGTCVIQPVDTIKVRIQIMGESGQVSSTNPFKIGNFIVEKEGVRGLYKGIDSALFRQATYATTRLGIYRTLYNKKLQEAGKVQFHEKAGFSLFAGFCGALVGNPSDLALVRFQSDSTLPPELRRNYRHVFHAFSSIVKQDGALSLWRGCVPTIIRAMSVNLGQLVSFDEFKELVTDIRGTWDMTSRIYTVTLSGIVCSVLSLPADNIKTKMMKMKKNAAGEFPYKNFMDCTVKSIQREGVLGLWIGLETYISRTAPHSILTLLVLDWLNHTFEDRENK